MTERIVLKASLSNDTKNTWRDILIRKKQPQKAYLLQLCTTIPIHMNARLWVPIYARDTDVYPAAPAHIQPIIEVKNELDEWDLAVFLEPLYSLREVREFEFEGRQYTLTF